MMDSLEIRLMKRIRRKRGDVFLRADFADLGGYDQVGRVLLRLVRAGQLIKIGQGLYARAIRTQFSKQPVPAKGLDTLREGLERVGVEVVPTRLEQDYSAGRTTQVPSGRRFGVTRRVRRRLGYNGFVVSFERARSRPR
jgi:hypothetical protein